MNKHRSAYRWGFVACLFVHLIHSSARLSLAVDNPLPPVDLILPVPPPPIPAAAPPVAAPPVAVKAPQTLNEAKLKRVRILGDPRQRHASSITQIIPLSDGKHVLTTARDSTTRLWDITTGREVRRFNHQPTVDVWHACILPGEKIMLDCGDDNFVSRWDLTTGKLLGQYNLRSTVLRLTLINGGKQFIAATNGNQAELWDLQANTRTRAFSGHTQSVYGVSATDDGKSVVTGSSDKSLKIWDVETGKCIHTITDHTSAVRTVTHSPNGKHFISCSSDNSVRMAEADTGKRVWTKSLTETTTIPAWSPDGKHVAVTCDDLKVHVFETATGKVVSTIPVPATSLWAISYSHDGKTIFTGGSHTLHQFDAKTGKQLFPDPKADSLRGPVTSMMLVHDDGHLVLSGEDRNVRLVDATSGALLRNWQAKKTVSACAMSPDGASLLVIDEDSKLSVLDAETGLPRFELNHENSVRQAAFVLGGQNVVAIDDNHTMLLIDAHSGRKIRSAREHTPRVNDLAVSADGRQFVTCDSAGVIQFWSAASGDALAKIEVKNTDFEQCVFAGKALLALDDDGRLHTWVPPITPFKKPPTKKLLTQWLNELGDEAFDKREAATYKLIAAGDDALSLLDRADMKDAEVRWRVSRVRAGISKSNAPIKLLGQPLALNQAGNTSQSFYNLTATPDGRHWAAVHGYDANAVIVLGELAEAGPKIIARNTDGQSPRHLHFTADGKQLFAGNRTGTVSVYAAGNDNKKQ